MREYKCPSCKKISTYLNCEDTDFIIGQYDLNEAIYCTLEVETTKREFHCPLCKHLLTIEEEGLIF